MQQASDFPINPWTYGTTDPKTWTTTPHGSIKNIEELWHFWFFIESLFNTDNPEVWLFRQGFEPECSKYQQLYDINYYNMVHQEYDELDGFKELYLRIVGNSVASSESIVGIRFLPTPVFGMKIKIWVSSPLPTVKLIENDLVETLVEYGFSVDTYTNDVNKWEQKKKTNQTRSTQSNRRNQSNSYQNKSNSYQNQNRTTGGTRYYKTISAKSNY